MIQEKYIELMNLELDGSNSASDTQELMAYLQEHPEAQRYFTDLQEAVGIFAKVEPLEPPRNLREDILAAVGETATDRCIEDETNQKATSRRDLVGYLRDAFQFRSNPSHAYAFAAGMLIGLFLFGALGRLNPGGGHSSYQDIYGTIVSQVESGQGSASDALDIDLTGITGTVQALYAGENILIKLKINSEMPVLVLFDYDKLSGCQGYKVSDPQICDLTVTGKRTELTHSGEGEYGILLLDAEQIQAPIRMQILTDDAVLSDQYIEPRRD